MKVCCVIDFQLQVSSLRSFRWSSQLDLITVLSALPAAVKLRVHQTVRGTAVVVPYLKGWKLIQATRSNKMDFACLRYMQQPYLGWPTRPSSHTGCGCLCSDSRKSQLPVYLQVRPSRQAALHWGMPVAVWIWSRRSVGCQPLARAFFLWLGAR